jgi:hypothetical protein
MGESPVQWLQRRDKAAFRYAGIALKRTDPGQKQGQRIQISKKNKNAEIDTKPLRQPQLNFSLLRPPPLLALSFSSPSAGR